ncbi:hypothetical protein HZC09_04355 [Candidatus Micrarchaeota archaeon]|nr:hypothetical protein [Candidatus Micrarchaeota archaeon]
MEKPKIVSLKEPDVVESPEKQVDVPDLPSEQPEVRPNEQKLPELPRAEKSEEAGGEKQEPIQLPEAAGSQEREKPKFSIEENIPREIQRASESAQSPVQKVLEPEELPLGMRPPKLERPEMKELRLPEPHEQLPVQVEQPKRVVFRPPVEQEDELAHELTSPKIVAVQETPTLVKEYHEQAARDILPPRVEPSPMMLHDERERAMALARELHEKEQAQGFVGQIKRFFRLG